MSSTEDGSSRPLSQPPPAPPLPLLSRIIAPLTFGRQPRTSGRQDEHTITQSSRAGATSRLSQFSQTVSHRTGIAISAVDINDQKTHAIIAGKDILRTIKVEDGKATEEFNLRSALSSYASAQQFSSFDLHKRREFWQAKAVRWSHGTYSHVVATAAHNGRVALYDVSTGSARVELALIYKHTGQVNAIDFDPHRGSMLLSGSHDKTCQIWDIRNPRSPAAWQQYGINASVRAVKWSPTDAYEIALCTESGQIMKWDIRFCDKPLLFVSAHSQPCYAIDWHPDGKHVVSGGYDHALRVWDLKTDNRRQKPILQLSTPGRIVNVAWRPPCWSCESADVGTWQTTQVVTSYDHIDPRIHVWDLRRPMLPFRELDRFDKQPQSLLWASKDLLWTVNNTGTFSQTDVRHSSLVQDQYAPCTSTWLADGRLAALVEGRNQPEPTYEAEPSAAFLNIPPMKLSGNDEAAISRSLTDDEGSDQGFSAFGRRKKQATSAKSVASQANTPPASDSVAIVHLDRSVFRRDSNFVNAQFGVIRGVKGIHVSKDTTWLLADAYARPMTQTQLLSRPDTILDHLSSAFEQNAVTCDLLRLHHTAQSWRILQHVVVGELRTWSEKNRATRMERQALEKEDRLEASKGLAPDTSSPFARTVSPSNDVRSPARSDKVKGGLFRGAVGGETAGLEAGSTSNTTTPLARPLSRTPLAGARKEQSTWFTLHDTIEPIQPLPPSIIASSEESSDSSWSNMSLAAPGPAQIQSQSISGQQLTSSIQDRSQPTGDDTVDSTLNVSEQMQLTAYSNNTTPTKQTRTLISSSGNPEQTLSADESAVKRAEDELEPAGNSDSSGLIFQDFCVVDQNIDARNLPFPLTAYKLIGAIMDLDIAEGRSGCQFSAHLLALIHPFFFKSSAVATTSADCEQYVGKQNLQLLDSQSSPRIIEAIFITYISHLKRLGFYLPAAEIKELCENLGYKNIARIFVKQSSTVKDDTLKIDTHQMIPVCTHCGGRIPPSAIGRLCHICRKKPSKKCPICEAMLKSASQATGSQAAPGFKTPSALTTYCNKCGHSAHLECMQGWLSTDFAQGECPTAGCGCACSVGPLRDADVASRNASREQAARIRQSSSSPALVTKRDSLKASKSPAVDRARHNLRNSISGKRGVSIVEPTPSD